MGADFVAAAVKAATYVLSIILVVGTKRSGRVTSPIQVRVQWFNEYKRYSTLL